MIRTYGIAAALFMIVCSSILGTYTNTARNTSRPTTKVVKMEPVGTIHKRDDSAWIELDPRFEDALLGLDGFSHVWVFWWFDRNDTPEKRRTLQVHPRGNTQNPLTGVFATRAPVRPNLIAMSLCRIRSVEGQTLKIEKIDAFDQTPVMDLKPFLPAIDCAADATVPEWVNRR